MLHLSIRNATIPITRFNYLAFTEKKTMNIVNKIIEKEDKYKILRAKGIIVLDDFKFDKTKKDIKETYKTFYKGGK